MKWKVIDRYFDSGKVKVTKPEPCPDNTAETTTEGENCDTYVNVFDTEDEALKYYREALKA